MNERLQGTDVDPGDAERVVEGVTDVVAETLTQSESQDFRPSSARIQEFFENVEGDRNG